ncbi:MAG: TolC family protein [Candidatus Omnitrophica bacterium]|nr:TolC family protein [Candidatus Omnitrophota bacterium]
MRRSLLFSYGTRLLLSVLLTVCFVDTGVAAVVVTHPAEPRMETLQPEKETTLQPVNAHEEMTRKAMRERISAMRHERLEKMPYLDKGHIRATINSKTIRSRYDFLDDSQKSLDDVINRATHVHLPAKASRERIVLAKRRMLIALRDLFPEVQLIIEHQDGVIGQPFKSRDARINFRQPVFRGGIIWNTIMKEKAELQEMQKEYEQVISDLRNEVAAAYFEYHRAREAVRERKEFMKKVDKYREISEKKWDNQIISEIEHLNVKSIFSQSEYDYETAVQELELAKLELQKYLDVSLNDTIDIQPLYNLDELIKPVAEARKASLEILGQDSKEPVEPAAISKYTDIPIISNVEIPDIDELVDQAYLHKPELQVQAAKLKVARLEERISWGQFMPRIDMIFEIDRKGEAFLTDTTNPGLRTGYRIGMEFQWNVGGNTVNYTFDNSKDAPNVSQFLQSSGSQRTTNTMTVNFLDGLEVFESVKEAEVQKLEEAIELDTKEQETIRDVKEAYFEYQRAVIQVKSSVEKMIYRERLLNFTKHRMDNNDVEVSEYLNAENEFLRERNDFHQVLTDYFTAKAKLNRAVGRPIFAEVRSLK